MELYGTHLHIISSLSGGFILYRNDKIPNIIKICTFVCFSILFYFLYYLNLSLFASFLYSLIIAIIVLIIELIVLWFNKLLDGSIELPSQENELSDLTENVGIPPGISCPLWEARSVLFNEHLPMDDRAFQLVSRGFDVDEVFRLISLVLDGTITKETRVNHPIRRIKTNSIILCGQKVTIHFDRDTLSRIFSRPLNYWHLLASIILAFLLPFSTSCCYPLMNSFLIFYCSIISTIALFSLLNPPPTDPFSTSFSDPYISYTRAVFSIFTSGLAATFYQLNNKTIPAFSTLPTMKTIKIKEILQFFSIPDLNLPNQINLEAIFSIMTYFCFYLYIFYPVLLFMGFIGQPITVMHYVFEVFDKYLFGISGTKSLIDSILHFFLSLSMFIFISLLLLFVDKNHFQKKKLIGNLLFQFHINYYFHHH